MKKEFFVQPSCFDEKESYGFAWQEHVTAIPSPLLLVTSYKENGKANATMQSWTTFTNDGGFYCILGSVPKYGHMYKTVSRTKALVINFPSADIYKKCYATIKNNGDEDDELALSGLTAEPASKVNAPRVKECFLNLECELVWEKEICEGSDSVVMCVHVINTIMDEEHYNSEKLGRYGKTGYLYNIHSPINPDNGKEDPTCIATLGGLVPYEEL